MAELVEKKVMISGNVVEFYEYENGYLKGYEDKIKKSGRKKNYRSEKYKENRKKTMQRAKTNLRRIVNSNFGQYGKHLTSKFVTLTFGQDIQDIKEANQEFTKFIKRLNYYVFKTKKANLKYSGVIEFTEKGRVHYHVVFYNLPYIPGKKIADIWENGIIDIKKIDNVDNVGAYICKYMSKDNEDPRLEGKKCYFNSRDLMKPEEITDKKRVEALLQALPLKHLKYRKSFDNEYTGTTNYYQFNTKYINDAIPSSSWTLKNIREE